MQRRHRENENNFNLYLCMVCVCECVCVGEGGTYVNPLSRHSNTPLVLEGRAAVRLVLRNEDSPPLPLFEPRRDRVGGW